MSADNYTFCPRCMSEKRRKIEELETALDEGYGKLHKKEWLDKIEFLEDLKSEKNKRTLGENYESWIDGKENPPLFFVQYSCSCENCRFKYSFTHEEVIQDNDQ